VGDDGAHAAAHLPAPDQAARSRQRAGVGLGGALRTATAQP
jgi:hypothetical protein